MKTENDLFKSFFVSLGLHGAAFLFFLFLTQVVLTTSNDNIEIIRASVRVDVVGMPKLTLQELKKMQEEPLEVQKDASPNTAAEVTKAEDIKIKATDIVEEKKEKERPKKLLSFLEKFSQQDIKKKPKRGAKVGGKTGSANIKLEGNQLSSGTALIGDISTGPDSPFAQYVQTLPALVREHWKLPSYLIEKNLKCRIKLHLSARGEILKTDIYESSGNQDYDNRARAAIKSASPFPVPDAEAARLLSVKGIILGFPL